MTCRMVGVEIGSPLWSDVARPQTLGPMMSMFTILSWDLAGNFMRMNIQHTA